MESAANALFDELVVLFNNDLDYYCERIDRECAEKVSDIIRTEEYRLGGMPMSGIMWDNVSVLIERQRAKAEQRKDHVRQHLERAVNKSFEWWVMPGPSGTSRLEVSLGLASS